MCCKDNFIMRYSGQILDSFIKFKNSNFSFANRFIFAIIGGILIHISYGYIYTTANIIPYLYSYLKFHADRELESRSCVWISAATLASQGIAMSISALFVKRINYHFFLAAGLFLHGTGLITTYFTIEKSLILTITTYSIMSGLGMGVGYWAVFGPAQSWSPKNSGVIKGLIVGGYGLSTLFFNPVQTTLINPFNADFNITTSTFDDDSVFRNLPYSLVALGTAITGLQIVGLLILHRKPNRESSENEEEEVVSESLIPKDKESEKNVTPIQVIRTLDFWLLWIIMFCSAFPITIINYSSKLFGQYLISSDEYLATVGSIAACCYTIGRLCWDWFVEKLSYKGPLCLLFLVWATCLGTFTQIDSYTVNFIDYLYSLWVCLFFFCISGVFAIVETTVGKLFGSENSTANYALLQTAFCVASPICAAIVNYALPTGYASYSYQYIGCVIPCCVGEIIIGDRRVNTPYLITMAINQKCSVLCDAIPLSQHAATMFSEFIKQQYHVKISLADAFATSYPLGKVFEGQTYIHNHLKFKLQYFTEDDVDEKYLKLKNHHCSIPTNNDKFTQWKAIKADTEYIHFTYEVEWQRSEKRWPSKWDIRTPPTSRIHWFSLLNSTIVVLILTGIIATILIRTLRRDIAKYNRLDAEDIIEESGWKLIHADIFRPPRYPRLLAALFGSGVQILFMSMIVIASRNTLLTGTLFTYVFMGLFAGYYAGRLYKTMRGQYWKSGALLTATLFPTLILCILSFVNALVWHYGSSRALPFTTALSLLSLWLCISLPLTFTGFYFGYRKRPYDLPTRTNQIPRAVPDRKWYSNLIFTTLCHGVLPFGVLFIEVFFIFMAIWESHIYYLFGFLFAVLILFVICCAQVSIMIAYVQLCNEDYRWWWRIFIASGGCSIYMFAYSILYFQTNLHILLVVPVMVYFLYTLLMAITLWILTGTIGLTATFIFLRVIYSAIKVD